MAAPQRRYRAALPTEPARPVRKRDLDRRPRDAVGWWLRRFAVLVMVPVLLMLGSVYLHTVATGLDGRIVALEARLEGARAEGQRLEVRVAELSRAERIRLLAAEKLGMRAPRSADLQVYVKDGEDGKQSWGEEKGGPPRRR